MLEKIKQFIPDSTGMYAYYYDEVNMLICDKIIGWAIVEGEEHDTIIAQVLGGSSNLTDPAEIFNFVGIRKSGAKVDDFQVEIKVLKLKSQRRITPKEVK